MNEKITESGTEQSPPRLETAEIIKKERHEWTDAEALHMLVMYEFERGPISDQFCELCGNPLSEDNQCYFHEDD